jgi:hypothetical protein
MDCFKDRAGIVIMTVSALALAALISTGIFEQTAGLALIVAYGVAALLYVTGYIRVLMTVLGLASTALVFGLSLAGDSLGLLPGSSSLALFSLWLIILAFLAEYFSTPAGIAEAEKLALYRQYLTLNIFQSFTLLFAGAILVMGPSLSSAVPAVKAVILDSFTVLIMLFFISFGLFASFILTSMFSVKFMSDFAKALYDVGRNAEYEDRKQGIKDGSPESLFIRTHRRVRLITYLMFTASVISLFFIAKTRIIDAYAAGIAGRSEAIDAAMHFAKYPPKQLVVLVRLIFLAVNLVIIREIYLLAMKNPKLRSMIDDFLGNKKG